MFRLTINCPGCGETHALTAEGLNDDDLDIEELASEILQRVACTHCGFNNLDAYVQKEATLH